MWVNKWALLFIALFLFIRSCVGPAFDDACIKGRLTKEQAEMLNVEENDRILNHKCSEISRKLFRW